MEKTVVAEIMKNFYTRVQRIYSTKIVLHESLIEKILYYDKFAGVCIRDWYILRKSIGVFDNGLYISNRVIADDLGISTTTVGDGIKKVFERLYLENNRICAENNHLGEDFFNSGIGILGLTTKLIAKFKELRIEYIRDLYGKPNSIIKENFDQRDALYILEVLECYGIVLTLSVEEKQESFSLTDFAILYKEHAKIIGRLKEIDGMVLFDESDIKKINAEVSDLIKRKKELEESMGRCGDWILNPPVLSLKDGVNGPMISRRK